MAVEYGVQCPDGYVGVFTFADLRDAKQQLRMADERHEVGRCPSPHVIVQRPIADWQPLDPAQYIGQAIARDEAADQ